MKKFILLAALFATQVTFAGKEVVYGEDNRKDIYQVTNALHFKLAAATAGMVKVNSFAKTSTQGILDLLNIPTLEDGQGLCPTEAFSQQLTAPICSGFLVGPDTLVTAGHCYKSFDTPENVCKSFVWVFDYDMKSATHNPTKNLNVQNVYLCKQIIAAKLDNDFDYSVIKLDRKVIGRTPLTFRTSGKIDPKTELVVIGHPSGLPTKVSDAGKVTRNLEETRFSTTLDTFHGNSGSAVFDAKTGVIEGILIQGKTDYQPSSRLNPMSCKVLNRCDNNGPQRKS